MQTYVCSPCSHSPPDPATLRVTSLKLSGDQKSVFTVVFLEIPTDVIKQLWRKIFILYVDTASGCKYRRIQLVQERELLGKMLLSLVR